MKTKFWQKTISVFLGLTLMVSLFANNGNMLAANSLKTLTTVWNNTNVTLEYSGDEIPEGAILQLESVDEQTETNAKEQIQSLIEDEVDTTKTVVLSLTDAAGNEITPKGDVNVSFEGTELNNISNVYTTDGITFTQVDATIDDTNVSFDTNTLGTYSFVSLKADTSDTTETSEKPDFVGNSNMFAAVDARFPNNLIDLDGIRIYQNTYNQYVNDAEKELTDNEIIISGEETTQNIPISWTRSSNYVTVDHKIGDNNYQGWTWSDVDELNTSLTQSYDVWDGSRLDASGNVSHEFNDSGYLSSNRITAYTRSSNTDDADSGLYDSATWEQHNGKVSIERFQGSFSLSGLGQEDLNDIENIDFTLSQVTDNEKLYLNDNMYVFIYPKGTEINDSNYLQYLSFWTGTVLQNRNDYNETQYRFHGIPGANIERISMGSSEGFKRLTNGWQMQSVTDNVGGSIVYQYKTTGATEYVIDIFAEDYNTGGGMYRYKLTATSPTTRQNYSFTKVDENNNPIAGAEFQLIGEDGSRYVTTSDENGKVSIIARPGTYTMTETKAPDGYRLSSNEWKVVLGNTAGNIQISNNHKYDEYAVLSGNHNKYTIKNTTKITGEFSFDKFDENGDSLQGATFGLFENAESEEPLYYATSNAQGKATFEDVLARNYVMKEISAPNGYAISEEVWHVSATVNGENVTFTIEDANGNKVNSIKNEKQKLEDIIDMNKDASRLDWEDRTYTIHLDATSLSENVTTTSSAHDIALILDYSKSMDQTTTTYGSLGKYNSIDKDSLSSNSSYYYKNSNNEFIRLYLKKDYWRNNYLTYDRWGDNRVSSAEDIYYSKTRLDVLKDSVVEFINNLAEDSPNSNITIIPFTNEKSFTTKSTKTFNKVGESKNQIITYVNNLTRSGTGTRPDYGLDKAIDIFKSDSNNLPNQTILFTDGEPDDYGSQDLNSLFKTSANNLKNYVEKLYTIAAADSNADWMAENIASPGCAYSTSEMADLSDIFEGILGSITTGSNITGATIRDYIDPRFEVGYIDGDGNWIAYKDGDSVTDGGILHIEDDQVYIEWTNQTINYKKDDTGKNQIGWEREFTIRAKEDFLGGNIIPTNGVESGITVGDETVYFEKPTVNVKEICPKNNNVKVEKILGQTIYTWNEVISDLTKFDLLNSLTETQKDELLEGKTLSVPYSYSGTNDVEGTITYTLSTSDGNNNDHVADKIGNPAETYTLKITYTPKTLDERENIINNGYNEPNDTFDSNYIAEVKECTAIGEVHVKAGSLTIYKTIDKYDATGGDPIFLYKISYKDVNGKDKVLYRVVRFTSANQAGNETLVGSIDGLPVGDYTVEELSVIKYTIGSVTPDTNSDKIADFKIKDEASLNHDVKFTNNLKESNLQTDKDVVKNSISKDENGHIVFDKDDLKD